MRRSLLALTTMLLAGGLVAPGAQAAPALGIPANTPTLFALNADAGTLTPVAGKRGRFVLTLSKLDRRGVWFTDKPARQSGSVRPAALFSSWKALGFAADPPNAVLTLSDGRAQADTAALELGTPRFSARTGTVRFNAKALSSLSAGLARHGTKVDAKLPRRFGNAALFIDDGQDDGQIGSGGGCSVGEVALLASEAMALPAGLQPAKGLALPIDENDPLYSLYLATFGAAPAGQFRIPNLTAPAGMMYVICQFGDFPFGPGAANDCATNEINAFPSVPGSNWTARRDIAPLAPGLTWYQCAGGPPGDSPPLCTIGQVTLFGGGAVGPGYLPADGRILSIYTNVLIYQIVANAFGGDATTFGLPNLPGPVSGTTYGVCATGIFPTVYYG